MDSNTINKYKDKTFQNLHARAKFYFHKFIRLRDTDDYGYGVCISSGQRLKYGNESCQAGHLFSAGHYKALEFNEYNVNIQSLSENYYNSGHEAMYTINLIDKIGKSRVDALQFIAKQSYKKPYKNDRFMMIEIIEKYKEKVKAISKTKMFEIK